MFLSLQQRASIPIKEQLLSFVKTIEIDGETASIPIKEQLLFLKA